MTIATGTYLGAACIHDYYLHALSIADTGSLSDFSDRSEGKPVVGWVRRA